MSALSYFCRPSHPFFELDHGLFNWPRPSLFHSRFPTFDDLLEDVSPTIMWMEWNPTSAGSEPESQVQQQQQQKEQAGGESATNNANVAVSSTSPASMETSTAPTVDKENKYASEDASTASNSSASEHASASAAAPSSVTSSEAASATTTESQTRDVQPQASEKQEQPVAEAAVAAAGGCTQVKKHKSLLSLWRQAQLEPFAQGLRWDVVEKDAHFEVKADVPGVAKEDIKLKVDGDVLTVTAEHKKEKKEENGKYRRLERTYGHVQRSLRLPHGVLANQVTAKHENGVLTISFPKSTQPEVQQVQIA